MPKSQDMPCYVTNHLQKWGLLLHGRPLTAGIRVSLTKTEHSGKKINVRWNGKLNYSILCQLHARSLHLSMNYLFLDKYGWLAICTRGLYDRVDMHFADDRARGCSSNARRRAFNTSSGRSVRHEFISSWYDW